MISSGLVRHILARFFTHSFTPSPFTLHSLVAKQTGILTTFRPDQRGWYEPYERDVDGQALDEVVDWAAMDYKVLRQEKVVATLMVLAAESIKSGKRSPDYWQAEGPWMAGNTTEVIRQSQNRVKIEPSTT